MKQPAEETFESIYRTCFPKLVAYLQPQTKNLHDAEDIASQTMQILWKKWDSLSTHTQPGILYWLFSAARKLLQEKARKEKHAPTIVSWEELPPQQHPEAPPDADPHRQDEEYRQALQTLSGQLTKKERELLLDKIERHRSDREIAEQYGITVNAVRIRWSRTKDRIAELMHVTDRKETAKERFEERRTDHDE